MTYPAHIAEDGRRQTVSGHPRGTAALSAGFTAAFAVAGHHGGLPDGGGQGDLWEAPTFCGRMKRAAMGKLAQSVLIFDEAQMLPVPYLRPCVYAIAQLVRCYGASAVLCTATQPALDGVFREFLPDKPAVELCPAKGFQQEIFRRVTFRRAGKLSWEAVAEQIRGQKQSLCIVNSRKSAQTIYGLLGLEGPEAPGWPARQNAVSGAGPVWRVGLSPAP